MEVKYNVLKTTFYEETQSITLFQYSPKSRQIRLNTVQYHR